MADTPSENKPKDAKTRSTFALLVSNVISMMASNVITRVTSFVIYVLVARSMGSYAFGQISLALSIFWMFFIFSIFGLRTLITREVAKDLSQANTYFMNSSFIVLITSSFSFLLAIVFVFVMGYQNVEFIPLRLNWDSLIEVAQTDTLENTATIIIILCVGLLPYTLSVVAESIFQAFDKMSYIAYINGPINVIRIILIVIMITINIGLYGIALMMLATYVIILVVEWSLLFKYVFKPKVEVSVSLSIKLFRASLLFFGIEGILVINNNSYLILLYSFESAQQVGLFSSAQQILIPFTIAYTSIGIAFFPLMCRTYDPKNPKSTKKITVRLLELLMMIAIPFVVGVWFMADWALTFIYGGVEFTLAADLLRILSLTTILRAFTMTYGQVLAANMMERKTLRIAVVNSIVGIILGAILIPTIGTIGAAVGTVAYTFVGFLQHQIPVSKLFSGISLIKLTWKTIIATMIMAVWLMIYPKTMDGFIVVIISIIVYAIALGIVMLVAIGSPNSVKGYYLGRNSQLKSKVLN